MNRFPLADARQVRRWVRAVATENRRAFTLTICCFVAATAVGLIAPRLLGRLLDVVTNHGSIDTLDLIALALLVVLVVQALLRRVARLRQAMLAELLLARAREGFVESVLRLPLSTVESTSSGDLMSRATSDVNKLDEGLRMAVPEITVAVLQVALTAVAMLITAPIPALGMLVAVPVLVLATRWYRPKMRVTLDADFAAWADAQSTIAETVEGGRVISALNRTHRRTAVNDEALGRIRRITRRQSWLWGMYCGSFEIAYVLPLVGILLIGWWAHQQGLVGIGALAAVLIYAQSLSDPLVEALSWVDELMVGAAALRRILGVHQLTEDDRAVCAAEPFSGKEIVLHDVRFGYREGAEVLHGVDLRVRNGERLAVVGPSGAGKSTLGRLIAGISPPTSGSITIGGVEVSSLDVTRLRGEVVLLTQEQHVFAASLRENVALATDTATDEQLMSALRSVGLGEWFSTLPAGLDTTLGSGAHSVHGAQAQQLALARLLLADPHTVVLDEATSLLDTDVSRQLDRSLSALLDGRTVIVVAHRLEVARTADRIAVVEDGRISELGSHADLLANRGAYALLYEQWSAGVR